MKIKTIGEREMNKLTGSRLWPCVHLLGFLCPVPQFDDVLSPLGRGDTCVHLEGTSEYLSERGKDAFSCFSVACCTPVTN